MAKVDIEQILDEEAAAATERATKRIMPILQKEFARLRKRYPKLQKVLFGHGTYVIIYGDKSEHGDCRLVSNLPKGLADFEIMCSAASGIQFCLTGYSDDLEA